MAMEQLELDFEEWRPAVNFEGCELYCVSNLGRAKHIECDEEGHIRKYHRKERIMRLGYQGKYRIFQASKDSKQKNIRIHNAVWEAFNGIIQNGYVIHHIDHNPSNNRLDNLQMVTFEEHNNIHRIDRINGQNRSHNKKVLQYTLNGEFVAEHQSITDAANATNAERRHISDVCNGKRNKCGGYIWRYKETAA